MAPCGWTVNSCGCVGTCSTSGNCWNTYSPSVQARAQAIAAHIMWAATGRRYGPCEITVMPAGMCAGQPDPDTDYRTYPVGGYGGGLLAPVIDGGRWYNRPSGSCCPGACEIALDGPTTTAGIVSVSVAGVALDEDAYEVQDGYLLVRKDGGCWPCCNNYGSAAAFTVVYLIGLAIPAAVQAAFETLACEFAKACVGGDCALPKQLSRLTRQGVEVEVISNDVVTEPGGLIFTGVRLVDDVIRADNPLQLAAPPLVLSPDMPRPRRRT